MGMWLKLGLVLVVGWSWDVVGIGEEVGAQSSRSQGCGWDGGWRWDGYVEVGDGDMVGVGEEVRWDGFGDEGRIGPGGGVGCGDEDEIRVGEETGIHMGLSCVLVVVILGLELEVGTRLGLERLGMVLNWAYGWV